ncbi:hypothetical protein NLX71_09935 [Paenibacillus sp. MZ04-78.2]|uniref:hypothetical protein n=1 Tax=Paenibacillus sp. MZ04-78.2 TaxID=2962034 RepID=UPI0020B682FE|nr:hypothetical protein [Paenibacillus sp. MZ04-78.2]MCP3773629.1 hypothetical protein [Paenibacillus sp. MZ04-78.2]
MNLRRFLFALALVSILVGMYFAFEKRYTGELITVTEVNAKEGYFRCYDDLGNYKDIKGGSKVIESVKVNNKYFINYTSDIFGRNVLEKFELIP